MMEDRVISFTKLGTVKSRSFEYTYSDFIDKMTMFVTHNIENYQVYYNPQDEDYEIVFKGVRYKLKYGKEKLDKKCEREYIVDALDRLVIMTKRQQAAKKEQEKIDDLEKRQLGEIVRNGDKGIFYSEDDKKTYIEYKKNNLNQISLTKGLLSEARKFISKRHLDLDAHIIAALSVILVCILGMASVLSMGFCLFVVEYGVANLFIGFVSSVITAIKNGEGRSYSPNYFLLSGLVGLGKMGKDFVGRLIEKMKNNKKLRLLKKSINATRTTQRPMLEQQEEVVEEKKEDKTKNNDALMQQVLREFIIVHDKVMNLKDKKKKEQYAKELLELTDKYKEEIEKADTSNYMIHKNLIDQVVSLGFRVDEELKSEQQDKSTQQEFDTLIEEVDRKTMGAR